MAEFVFSALIVIGVLALILAAWIVRSRHRFKQLCGQATTSLHNVYRSLAAAPTLKARYVYSFPAFTVDFATKADCVQAEQSGANEQFVCEIQRICQNEGTRERPFDARQAVAFNYPGRLEEYVQGIGPNTRTTRSDA